MSTRKTSTSYTSYAAIKLYVLLLMLSFAGNMLAQQGRCRIYGTIKDEKGSPIELASVRIDKQPSTTITNLNGKYSIYCTSRDTVTIIYSMIGYETRKRTIHNPVDSIRIDVMLPSFDANLERPL